MLVLGRLSMRKPEENAHGMFGSEAVAKLLGLSRFLFLFNIHPASTSGIHKSLMSWLIIWN
jgi:hypothetical protein